MRAKLRTCLLLFILLLLLCAPLCIHGQSCDAFGSLCVQQQSQPAAAGPVPGGPPSNYNLPASWPPKPPLTLRFSASLNSSDVPSVQARQAYEFWAHTVNDIHGGIPVGAGNSKQILKVELQIMDDMLTADNGVQHTQNMIDAVRVGHADFLLGGSTSLAAQDLDASIQAQRATVLCCHGPPVIYARAYNFSMGSTNGTNGGGNSTVDYLFGMHIDSENYAITLVRHIALNQKAKLIAVLVLNSPNPDTNLFPNTTCQAAINELDAIKNSSLYMAPPEYVVMMIDESQQSNITYFQELSRGLKNTSVNGANVDMVLACTLDTDGRNLMLALQQEEVPLKGVFSTVAPTSVSTVSALTQCQNVTMSEVLSAGQWHPEVPFLDQNSDALWPSALSFAESFQNWSSTNVAATYTHASSAAAPFVIQSAITNAFATCDLSKWTSGDVNDLLYNINWPCGASGAAPARGYDLILSSLRQLKRDSFFGPIQFDVHQRNSGRDTITLQLLGASDRSKMGILGSIDFGCDADGNMTLVQEAVLPSQYETKAIVLPRTPRVYDTPCPDGQGLDANNDCQPCQPGTARSILDGAGIDNFMCHACNLTSFASDIGQAYCIACPDGTRTNILGATSLLECGCQTNFYNETGQAGVPCSTCPQGATCAGGTAPPYPLPGYWTDRSSPALLGNVFTCNPATSCLNDPSTNQTCADGWGGRLCSLCGYDNASPTKPTMANHYLLFGTCSICPSKPASFFIFVGILLLWAFLNIFLLEKWEATALVVDWMQLLSMVGNINANWPIGLQVFFNLAALFAFEVNVVSWQCLEPQWNFLYDMILQLALPWFLMGCLLLIVGIYHITKHMRRETPGSPRSSIDPPPSPRGPSSVIGTTIAAATQTVIKPIKAPLSNADMSWTRTFGRMLSILEITYLASTSFAMSALRYIVVSGQHVLANYPYTLQTTAGICVGAIGLTVYGVLFPLCLVIKLWSMSPDSVIRRRKKRPEGITRLEDDGGFREEKNVQLFGWLYEKFKVERYYMAHMHLLHRFIFIAAVTLLIDPALQLLTSTVITLVFAVLFLVARPYFLTRVNVLQAVLYISIVCVLVCGIGFYSPLAILEGSFWSITFQYIGYIILGLAGGVFLWVSTIEILEYLCRVASGELLLQHLYLDREDDKGRQTVKRITKLADVFCSVRLWSWSKHQVFIRTKRYPNFIITMWCALRRELGFVVRPLNSSRADSTEKIRVKDKINQFQIVANHMEYDLGAHHRLGRLSTAGDAILWRQLLQQYPELLTYLFNEPHSVSYHWNAFFQVFYNWYWCIHDTRGFRRWLLRPFLGSSSDSHSERSHMPAAHGRPPPPPVPPPKPSFGRRETFGAPTYYNVERVFKAEHSASIAAWLALKSDQPTRLDPEAPSKGSTELKMFIDLTMSIAAAEYISFAEKIFRVLNLQAPLWVKEGEKILQKRKRARQPVYNLVPNHASDADETSPSLRRDTTGSEELGTPK